MYPPIYLEYCFHEYQWDLHHNTGFSILIFLSDIDLIQDPEEIWTTVPYLQSRQDQVWFHCGPVSLMQELLQLWPLLESVLLRWLSACGLVRLPVYALHVLQFIIPTICEHALLSSSNISLIGMTLKASSKATWYVICLLICQFILGGREGWIMFRVMRMIGNERNLFYTFLFIHYLPKNKTPFVEMVYLMYNYIIFSKGNKLLPASHCINWNINFNLSVYFSMHFDYLVIAYKIYAYLSPVT